MESKEKNMGSCMLNIEKTNAKIDCLCTITSDIYDTILDRTTLNPEKMIACTIESLITDAEIACTIDSRPRELFDFCPFC